MSQHGIRYIANDSEREFTSEAIYSQKTRETYISPNKDIRSNSNKELKPFTTSPARFSKPQIPQHQENVPPRNVPFRRSRNQSIDRIEKDRSQCKFTGKGIDDGKKEVLRFSALKKKLEEEMQEREKLQQLTARQDLKISNLGEEINKLRGQKKQLDKQLLEVQRRNEQTSTSLMRSQQNVEQLTKSLRDARINQKSLTNLKNIQNQLEYLQERNKKLTHQNDQLHKVNKTLKNEIEKLRESSSESDGTTKAGQSQMEMKKLLGQLQKNKTERQLFLEAYLKELEKKLYQTQNEMKKVLIQLNCIDRKKILSIDQVKTKKDQQIKDLRQRITKVSKDLRQTKDKFEKNQKRRSLKESAFLRKVKSSKHIGMTSESEQVTFQLSSQV